ncbi:MAG: ATP phosphoribosyltransferase [Chloroflexota bacterium]|nr:MAG: ATP phosphoribosyltransferase [Chloroflexota bacterium]
MDQRTDIRLSLPSKGRLAQAALNFLAACGLEVDKPNPRQYAARIPALPGLTVLFQRPGDIVVSVRDGSVDFGITGMDVVAERQGDNGAVLVLHDALNFGKCHLCLAVPEEWETVHTMADLVTYARTLSRPLRVATKFPHLTGDFLTRHAVTSFAIINAEGTLEVAPAIGYADIIADLVSSGQTLRDNRLRPLDDGVILHSQAALIANRPALKARPEVLDVARKLLEFVEAHLRAADHVAVFANMRGASPQAIAERMFAQDALSGLQGPTISPVIVRDGDPNWYAVHIVVRREQLFQVVAELRAIGGSGVVVAPVAYIFEEEPARYRAMMEAVQEARGEKQGDRGNDVEDL